MEPNFENKLTYRDIVFRYARGKSLKSGNEIHPYYEILFYMGGDAHFLSEQFEQRLTENTLLFIPKHTYHHFLISDQENYTRMVLNFPDMDMFSDFEIFQHPEIIIIPNISHRLKYLLDTICSLSSDPNLTPPKESMLYGAFLMLTAQIDMDKQKSITPKTREDDALISRCLQYIDKNFCSGIRIEDMADALSVSQSNLHKCFRKHLGISIYKYITKKRMMHANMLLDENRLPTKIYLECGYNDYPTFYKAYVKSFGHPPSSAEKQKNTALKGTVT